jgi:hypothetical protein
LRTRAADFGMASFRNDSFPGANSEPLALMKKGVSLRSLNLGSEAQLDITLPYGSARASSSSRVCEAFRNLMLKI